MDRERSSDGGEHTREVRDSHAPDANTNATQNLKTKLFLVIPPELPMLTNMGPTLHHRNPTAYAVANTAFLTAQRDQHSCAPSFLIPQ